MGEVQDGDVIPSYTLGAGRGGSGRAGIAPSSANSPPPSALARAPYSYFDGRGLAEVSRTLFATAGRFSGQGFTDVRLSSEEFATLRDSGTGVS